MTQADMVAQYASQFEGDYGEVEFEELNENLSMRDLMRMQLNQQDTEMVKQSLEILDDLRIGAEAVEEMRSEVAIEIYETCAFIQKKSQKIIEAKLMAMDNQMVDAGTQAVDVDGYLTMIDQIATKLNAFKQKYSELKELAISEYKAKL